MLAYGTVPRYVLGCRGRLRDSQSRLSDSVSISMGATGISHSPESRSTAMKRAPTYLLALSSLLIGEPAIAYDWGPTGVSVCDSCRADIPQILPDGHGGAFIAWRDFTNGSVTGNDVFLQRITNEGQVAPGWPSKGLPVCRDPGSQHLSALTTDGQGGVFLIWNDDRGEAGDIYAQRVLADGSIAPGWPENGISVSRGPSTEVLPIATHDGLGGAFVSWSDYRNYAAQGWTVFSQHLTSAGEVADGWPATGLQLCNLDCYTSRIIPDGMGGAVIAWNGAQRGDVYGIRVTAGGSVAPGWAENGTLLVGGPSVVELVTDDNEGFYAACAFYSQGWQREYLIQRFTNQGTVATGWPEAGVRLSAAPGVRAGLGAVPDATGGILLAWYDYRNPEAGSDVYGGRVLAEGVYATGWPSSGLLVSDPAEGSEYEVDVCSDGRGGAYVAWEWDAITGTGCRLQHIAAEGTVAPGWPAHGVRVSETSNQFRARLASDNAGGVIVTWEERESRLQSRHGIYAQRFSFDGPVPALPSLTSTEATQERVVLTWEAPGFSDGSVRVQRRAAVSAWTDLGPASYEGASRLRYEDWAVVPGERYAYRLGISMGGEEVFTPEIWITVPTELQFALEGFRPNPATGSLQVAFTLPSVGPAQLELFDAAGRLRLSREVGLGPGQRTVAVLHDRSLATGVYWIQLRQAGQALRARGVVVR